MPSRVSLGSSSGPSNLQKLSLTLIPRRGEALASLQDGERLTVAVLERFGAGKVLLELRGAAVTARAEGEFPVAARLEVLVQRQGQAIVLRRIAGDEPSLEALLRAVRAATSGAETRAAETAALAKSLQAAQLTEGSGALAALYARLGKLLAKLLEVGASPVDQLRQWAALVGAAPPPVGERLREFLGRNLPAVLDRILAANRGEIEALLAKGAGDPDELTGRAAAVKEQLGFLRALNGLLATRDGPSYLALPFMLGGEPQPTELWFYREKDASRQRARKDPETSSALIRLRLSHLGEVRALVIVRRTSVQASLHAERAATAEIIDAALPELSEGLRAVGLTPRLSVGVGLEERPLPSLGDLLASAGEPRGVSVKA
jgi:hypothetical protein